jgi:hypothetical protein
MTQRTYPTGLDCVWIACDARGQLGAFTTGGVGPIPIQALSDDVVALEDIEEKLHQLPRVSIARLLVSMKRPDDFVALAERGLFVYDWHDVHRTTQASKNMYELIAAPVSPISLNVLPDSLAKLAASVRFSRSPFGEDNAIIDVGKEFGINGVTH